MIWFKNIKIRTKLFIVFGFLVSMVIILAVLTIRMMGNIDRSYTRLTEGPLLRVTYTSDAVRELTTIRRYILSMGYASESSTAVDSYYERYMAAAESFVQYIDDYYENLEADHFLTDSVKEERKALLLDIKERFQEDYAQYVFNIYQASLDKDTQRVNELILGGIPLGDEITEKLSELRALVQRNAVDISSDMQAVTETSSILVVVIAASIVVTALLLSILMSRSITRPIVNIGSAVSEIAKGNLIYPIRSDCKDEVGVLSNRIGDMVDTISMLNRAVAIMDNIDVIIFVTDLEHNLIQVNDKMAETFGFNKEQCVNQKCYKLMYGNTEPCPVCPLPKLLPEKENLPTCNWERHTQIGGKDIWLACRTSIVRWVDGNLVKVSVCQDDTIRKEREEQQERHQEMLREAARTAEEASRMKSAFLANMSHEIRTPMNGIIGFSELALDDNISLKTKDYLNKIKAASESLLQIINDILDISKIEAGKIVLEEVAFDLHEVFRLCQVITAPKAMEKGIALFCYAEPSLGKMLIGDPTRLRQALLNLLSNAVKFTNNGMVKLLSAISYTGTDSVTVHFEVKDSGIGMTKEQIGKIFSPFVQADNSTTRKFGGTGLGLTITKNIIELMGGELGVESALGLGSKFSFDLTFKTIDMVSAEAEAVAQVKVLNKPTFDGEVLVCEDNTLNQQVVSDHLLRVGLMATIAPNGRDGVEFVKRRLANNEKPFDLIFMDIHMPVMDGLEAAKALMEMNNKTPVVALTANVMPNDQETYKTFGMNYCVAKPFTAQELWACLLNYITPIRMTDIDENEHASDIEKQREKLYINFFKDNQTTFQDIKTAISDGDIKVAHRLAHTLKGVAGLIGKTMLQDAAFVIEQALAEGKTEALAEQMAVLDLELNMTLNELAPLVHEQKLRLQQPEVLDKSKAFEVLDKLDLLLNADSFDCLDLVDELAAIPGTELIVEQIELFKFAQAREALVSIRQALEVE